MTEDKIWADRLMSEHDYDRDKAVANIPKSLTSDLQFYIADKLKYNCWGPPGGPHCICSFPEDDFDRWLSMNPSTEAKGNE